MVGNLEVEAWLKSYMVLEDSHHLEMAQFNGHWQEVYGFMHYGHLLAHVIYDFKCITDQVLSFLKSVMTDNFSNS